MSAWSSSGAAKAAAVAEAFVALGGNVGDVRATFDRAIAALCDGAVTQLTARSSDYRTPPWGVTAQPPFINAVIAVLTMLSPHGLLDRAMACEQMLGRRRNEEQRWGPRPIDLDLLAYDDLELNDATLILPHPQLFARPFVLVPLAEIASDRMIGGVRVRDALARVGARGIEKLPPRSRAAPA
jgi:2-amino-4-hydroxy-6-hydroxymethyldihydropteridine diphosphokinase